MGSKKIISTAAFALVAMVAGDVGAFDVGLLDVKVYPSMGSASFVVEVVNNESTTLPAGTAIELGIWHKPASLSTQPCPISILAPSPDQTATLTLTKSLNKGVSETFDLKYNLAAGEYRNTRFWLNYQGKAGEMDCTFSGTGSATANGYAVPTFTVKEPPKDPGTAEITSFVADTSADPQVIFTAMVANTSQNIAQNVMLRVFNHVPNGQKLPVCTDTPDGETPLGDIASGATVKGQIIDNTMSNGLYSAYVIACGAGIESVPKTANYSITRRDASNPVTQKPDFSIGSFRAQVQSSGGSTRVVFTATICSSVAFDEAPVQVGIFYDAPSTPQCSAVPSQEPVLLSSLDPSCRDVSFTRQNVRAGTYTAYVVIDPDCQHSSRELLRTNNSASYAYVVKDDNTGCVGANCPCTGTNCGTQPSVGGGCAVASSPSMPLSALGLLLFVLCAARMRRRLAGGC
ncbi:MAG: hypothetical protein H6707_01705 [Deltaproteobacteria bacterium]|nr:hypothetical protein [Deltaproteobacteria bacterium]